MNTADHLDLVDFKGVDDSYLVCSLSQKAEEESLGHVERVVGPFEGALDVLDADQLAHGLDHAVGLYAVTCR